MIILQFIAFIVLSGFFYSIFEGMLERDLNRILLSLALTVGMTVVMIEVLGAEFSHNIDWVSTGIWTLVMLGFYYLGEKFENKLVETGGLVCSVGLFICLF